MTPTITPDNGLSTAQVAKTLAAIACADGRDIPSPLSDPALAMKPD